jgi:hypothetical protein
MATRYSEDPPSDGGDQNDKQRRYLHLVIHVYGSAARHDAGGVHQIGANPIVSPGRRSAFRGQVRAFDAGAVVSVEVPRGCGAGHFRD